MNCTAGCDAASILWNELSRRARVFADRTAIATPDGEASFSQILAASVTLSDQLDREGVKRGDVIGHCLPNSIDFVVVYLALCRLQAVVMLVSTKYQTSELQAIATGTRADYFITSQSMADTLVSGLPSAGRKSVLPCFGREPVVLIESGSRPRSTENDRPWQSVEQADRTPTLIKFTSGSTGEPKGILLSVGNVLAEARNVVDGLSLTPDDRILSAVPAFHSYGFDLGVLAALFSGARLELRESFVPRRILSELADPAISVFLGVPSMYRFFLEVRLAEPPDLSHIRYPLSCTAPLDPAIVETFHEKFGATICQHYGSSESGAATNHVPAEVLKRVDSVGRALKNVRVRVVDPDGQNLPVGSAGEVVLGSDAIALGYLMGRPSDGSPIRGGEYWTGDIGRLDNEGFLYITGRIDKMINVGGMKVSPDEVAHFLESCPVVRGEVVVGARDGAGEEVVYAAVTLRASADENELLAYCRDRLAEYKIPRRIDILQQMPRGATGKVRLRPEDLNL